MRPPVDHIPAPPFPAKLPWINTAMLRMDQQLGRPVLIEFWDFCRANSLRTLPYVEAWHERYETDGLRVIGVHTSGFPPSADPDAVSAAVVRLGVRYPVVVDTEYEIWKLYGNLGWPARYLFNQQGLLHHYHYGEGGYGETEAEIQELLGVKRPLLDPLRPEDVPDAVLAPQTEDIEGPYSGPYEAGAVWAVVAGAGMLRANGVDVAADGPACVCLIAHEHSTAGVLELSVGDGVTCHAVCFTPGVAPTA